MKKKHLMFFIAEIACTVMLVLLAILSLKKDYTPLFLASIVGISVCSLLMGYYKASLPKAERTKKDLGDKPARKISSFWLVVSLLLLINQSIGIVDLLPDYISYLIIARALSRASYKAPNFSEAKSAFLKLALVNALKFPALILTVMSTTGNDLTAVMSLSFAVIEFIFLLSAIKNLFDALFRLGERTEALSLIRPLRFLGFKIPVEFLRSLTMIFAVTRCLFEFIPDLYTLTGTTGDGFTIVTMRVGYPLSIIFTQLVGTLLGLVWIFFMLKYLYRIRKEGKLYAALDMIEKNYSPIGFKTKKFVAKLKLGLSFILLAALLSVELKFDTLLEINMLPHAIQALFFTVGVCLLGEATGKKKKKILVLLSVIYTVISLISYVAEINFMYEYGYRELLKTAKNADAQFSYMLYEISSVIETVVLITFISVLASALKKIILQHTAIPPNHERYSRADADYHKAFIRRSRLLCASGIIMALARTANVFTQAYIDTFFTTQPVITLMPSIPWFGLFVFITAAIYGGLSLYFTSILKEDVEMKYIEQ